MIVIKRPPCVVAYATGATVTYPEDAWEEYAATYMPTEGTMLSGDELTAAYVTYAGATAALTLDTEAGTWSKNVLMQLGYDTIAFDFVWGNGATAHFSFDGTVLAV